MLRPYSPLHEVSIIYSMCSKSQQILLVRRKTAKQAAEGLVVPFQLQPQQRMFLTSSLLRFPRSLCNEAGFGDT